MFRKNKSHELSANTESALRQMVQEIDKRNVRMASEIIDLNAGFQAMAKTLQEGTKLIFEQINALAAAHEALSNRVRDIEMFILPSQHQAERHKPEIGQKFAIPVSAGLQIEYQSAAGKISKRTVIPQQAEITPRGQDRIVTEIIGYCTTRRAVRTFILNRIITAFDAETGESVDPQNWILARCNV